jgi:6-phosphogluconolactonase
MINSNSGFVWQIFPTEEVERAAAQAVADHLQERAAATEQTVVLLSGGSAIKMYALALSLLPAELSLQKLIFGLVDERRGGPGHPDSNETQLRAAGVIDQLEKRGAKFVPLLSPTAMDDYTQLLHSADFLLILAGMGEDGHTLGWLPTATTEKFQALYDKTELLSEYDVDPHDSPNPFTKRITITLPVIRQADLILVYATGAKKLSALQELKNWASTPMPFVQYNALPAAALSETKNPVQVFTDQELVDDAEPDTSTTSL